MPEFEPLLPTVGPPAEGDRRFFPRERIIAKILRKLRSGNHLLISAPRRIGKSSILKQIEKHPESGQIIKYLIVQSVDSEEEFFKHLYNGMINDPEIFAGLDGYLTRTTAVVRHYVSRVTSVSLGGKVTVDSDEKVNYFDELVKLIESITIDKKIILFIDEFPDALNNILEKDRQSAIRFLQKNRDLRQRFSAVQFVYTGSTGLKNVVKKLNKLDLVNDVHEIPIGPFEEGEAKLMLQRLLAGFKEDDPEFHLDDAVLDCIVKKITWRLPYYLQIIMDELFEDFDRSRRHADCAAVDRILGEIVRARSSHAEYFENWKRRLRSAFKDHELALAIAALNHIACHDTMSLAEFHDLSVRFAVEEYRYVLDVLMHDGYVSEHEALYGFNSILLKEWWFINVAT